MKLIRLKKVMALTTLFSALLGSFSIYAEDINTGIVSNIDSNVWKINMQVGDMIPTQMIKDSFEHKYQVTLGEEDLYQVTWNRGEQFFAEGVAINSGDALMKIKIRDFDDQGDCRLLTQCVSLNIIDQPQPVAHIPYITGYEDGTFRPDQGVTREELATMIGRLMLDGQQPTDKESFEDVVDTRYSAPYIAYVTQIGIMEGSTESTFNPQQPVSQQEFMHVIKKLNHFYGNDLQVETLSTKNITRVESLFLLNDIFERHCTDVVIENLYSDITPTSFGYDQILYASIYHTH